MRVTSNTYPELLKSQLQYLQDRQLTYQNQISTGLKLSQASDNPSDFHEAQSLASNQSALKSYMTATNEARALGETNYKAMTDLQRLVTRASELAMRSSSPHTPDEQQIIGEEMGSILDQVVQLANRQYNDRYLFGGTKNVAPIVKTADGPPPTYEYNNAPLSAAPNTPDAALPPSYTSSVTQSEIADGNVVNTGFVAGRIATDDPAGGAVERPAFSGFLCDGTTDILATLTNMRDTMNGGAAVTPAQLGEINSAVNLAAEYVGKSASRLSVLDLNEASLKDLIKSGVERLDSKTAVSLTDAMTELQKTQLHYQAALQSGAQILNMSLLNYLQ